MEYSRLLSCVHFAGTCLLHATYSSRQHGMAQLHPCWLASRRLVWRPHLGTVQLEVSSGDVCIKFHVSPPTATILTHFSDASPSHTAQALAVFTGLTAVVVRSKAAFWVKHGVLAEERQTRGGPGGRAVMVYTRATTLPALLDGGAQHAGKYLFVGSHQA